MRPIFARELSAITSGDQTSTKNSEFFVRTEKEIVFPEVSQKSFCNPLDIVLPLDNFTGSQN